MILGKGKTDKERIVIGVIGLGHWGPNVARNFFSHNRVKLKYLCDINEAAFTKVVGFVRYPCEMVTDPAIVFQDPEVHAVAIVTPASTHYELAKKALLAGKHVFCEKPLTMKVEEDKELCSLAEKAGLKLMVGFTFIYNNGIQALKQLKNGGRLGDVYYITAVRTHMGLVRRDVDVMGDLAAHDISIMNFLLDSMPESVMASGAKPLGLEKYDVAFITLHYPRGVIGNIHVSWVDSNKERGVRIIGSQAMVEFDDLNNLEPVRIYEKGISLSEQIEADYGNFKFLLRDGDIISPKVTLKEPLSQMLDAFVKTVLDGEAILTDGRFGMDVTRCLTAIKESMVSGSIRQVGR
jgi:predicted dehydrogenase